MGSRGDTGAALARLRQMRSGFNANQLKEASERWTRCRESWRDEREHATCARALEVLASRAAEGVRAKGAPSRGGPVRAEVAAVLRAVQTTDAIAAIVASPSPAAARVACRSLDTLLSVVSAASATRPSAPLIAALATRVAHDPAIADAATALAAASSLRRLAGSPAALDDPAVADALRAARAAPALAARLVRFATPESARHALPVEAVAPAAVAAAALAPRRDLWDFLEGAGRETEAEPETRASRPGAAALAAALAAAAARAARERRFDVAGAALDTAAALASRRETFRLALCRPEAGLARATAACVEGVGFREADAAPAAATRAAAAAFRALAAAAPHLPAPGDCADWKRAVEALVRAVAAHAECARDASASSTDAAAASRRAAAATATAAAAALVRPRRRIYGAPASPPPPWRGALLGAGVVAALRESAGAWADAGVANRGLSAVARSVDAFGVEGFESRVGARDVGGPTHAWRAAERLAVPGESPAMRAEDAEALTRSALATIALVAPPSTRREEAVVSILAARRSASAEGDERKAAPPPLVACAGAGARDAAAEAAAAAAGRALCAFLECDATRAAATRALDETRDLLGGHEWTRCVGRHLSLGVGVTPAKACLAAALARLPSGRAALGEAGAAARVAATLVDVASAARAAAERRRRAEGFGDAGAEDDAEDDAETDAEMDAAECRFEARAGFADERKGFGFDVAEEEAEARRFAPFRWRAGDAALVAASLRALVELAAPRSRGSPDAGGKDAADAADAIASSRRETIASLPPALAATLAALASEEGAAGLGDDDAANEIRCWSLLACACVGADACAGGAGGAARVAAALARALPESFSGSEAGSEAGPGSLSAADQAAARAASPVAPPDVCFVLADGARQPAHAALLAARCPALTESCPSAPSSSVTAIKLGAGVTRRALRAVLRWAYSGALDADVFDSGVWDGDAGLDVRRAAVAKLASKCGAHELARCARFGRPKPGARLRRLTEALLALMTSGTRADVFLTAEGGEIAPPSGLSPARVFPAHRVVLCARAEYFRAALDPARGFRESREPSSRAAPFPAATPEALAAALRAAYAGAAPRVDADAEQRRSVGDDAERRTSSSFATSATTAVHLAASLEYLMLDREAEACASRVAFAARAGDWRGRLGGVAGALEALAAAAGARRWAELEALLGAVAAVYPEAAETEPEALEAIHPDLREEMRRAHVQRTRAR